MANEVDNFRRGNYGPVTPEQVDAARTGELVPILRDRFQTASDEETRMRIAGALLRLGDKDTLYWNALVDYARPALESDAPSPIENTPEWRQWASTHHLANGAADQAELASLANLWTRVAALAASRDPREIPLLRRALQSPNFQIVSAAAEGLTGIRDQGSIPFLIEACKRAPANEAHGLASNLRIFDFDAQAKAVADAYDPPPDPLQALAKNDEVSPSFLEQVAEAHTVKAIPILKRNFAQMGDPHDKAHTASVLIRLGEKDPIYWNFLLQQATAAVESDAPDATAYDAQGKPLPDPSPAFVAWAKAHNLSLQTAGEQLLFGSGDVAFLGMTGDPRAIPTLRRGLSSTNVFTLDYAAEGLAKLQDRDSVPLIIETCTRARREVANLIASNALIFFTDPRAQHAAETFLSPDELKTLRADKHYAPGTDPFTR